MKKMPLSIFVAGWLLTTSLSSVYSEEEPFLRSFVLES